MVDYSGNFIMSVSIAAVTETFSYTKCATDG